MNRVWLPGLVIALASVGGCTVGPNYQRPQMQLPANWTELNGSLPATTQPTTRASAAAATPIQVVRWWTAFNDKTLDSLIDRAVRANLDLRQAEARIREARAMRGVIGAGQYPTASVFGSYTREKGSENGTQFGPNVPPAFRSLLGQEFDLFNTGFDASWEIDIFGGVRRSVEAADADLAGAVEGRNDALVSLLGEVARNYIDLRGLQQEIVIAQNNVQAQQSTLAITRDRFRAGLTTQLDVSQAEAQLDSTMAQIPTLQSLSRQAVHRLGVLLAQEPGALVGELAAAGPIPLTPPVVPIGLPSELLQRRPDIRRAERALAAATARIGVATADLYPRFSLTGNWGMQSNIFTTWLNFPSRYWMFGPTVSWPIFDAGRIRFNIAAQDARTEQALAAYQKSVLNALREVEDALVAYAKDQERRQLLTDAVAANRRTLELANQLYQQGTRDFVNVLDAERSLFAAEDQLIQSERIVSNDLVALYKALGGGWEVK